MKLKIIKIHEKMYGIPLRLIIAPWEEYKTHIKKTYGFTESEQRFFGGMSYLVTSENKGEAEGIIWMPSFDNSMDSISTLAHECLHIAIRVLDKMGVITNIDNQEPLCYLQQYYFKAALEKMQKRQPNKTA